MKKYRGFLDVFVLKEYLGEIYIIVKVQRDYKGENSIAFRKLYFFHEKSKKSEKETSTNFALLCQSRNMVGQFRNTYFA